MTNNEVGIDFFVSPDTNLQRRVVASDIKVSSGNQMVVRDLSGEHYQHLDLTIQPGSNTVIIGDNVAARQELVHDLAHAREIEGSKLQLPKDARIEFVSPTITNIGEQKNINPNNIKVGDMIEVEQAWEDETGNFHDEFAKVLSINEETGDMELDFDRDDINEFLQGAEHFAKDYKPE
jgi:hypothetical protein